MKRYQSRFFPKERCSWLPTKERRKLLSWRITLFLVKSSVGRLAGGIRSAPCQDCLTPRPLPPSARSQMTILIWYDVMTRNLYMKGAEIKSNNFWYKWSLLCSGEPKHDDDKSIAWKQNRQNKCFFQHLCLFTKAIHYLQYVVCKICQKEIKFDMYRSCKDQEPPHFQYISAAMTMMGGS